MKLALLLLSTAAAEDLVWPPPRSFVASGPPVAVNPSLKFETLHSSPRLDRTITRFTEHFTKALAAAPEADATIASVRITITDPNPEDERRVTERTNYSYSVRVRPTSPIAEVTVSRFAV